jgi:hypothetical protein
MPRRCEARGTKNSQTCSLELKLKLTEQQGAHGYFIRARSMPTRVSDSLRMLEHDLKSRQEMISDLMAESRSREEENLDRRGGSDPHAQSYRSTDIREREDPYSRPGRLVPAQALGSQEYPIRQQSRPDYASGRLFHPSAAVNQPPVIVDRERPPNNRPGQTIVRGGSEHEGIAPSQTSTYDSRWSGSQSTRRSSHSSHSTAPSSVQSSQDEQRRMHGSNRAQAHLSRTTTSHLSSGVQGLQPANGSLRDTRTGERAAVGPGRGVTANPRPSSIMESDDDPPDWDDVPYFRELARGHDRTY